MRIEYVADGHHYYLVGEGMREEIPGVTAVLSSAGLIDTTWFSRYDAERGRIVHRATALDDQGLLDESTVDPKIRGYVDANRLFRSDYEVKIERMEYVAGHIQLRYGGRADRRVRIVRHPRPLVLDFKSGHRAAWHRVQLGGYVGGDLPSDEPRALSHRWQATDGMIVYLKKDGRYAVEIVAYEEMAALVREFRGLVLDCHARKAPMRLFEED